MGIAIKIQKETNGRNNSTCNYELPTIESISWAIKTDRDVQYWSIPMFITYVKEMLPNDQKIQLFAKQYEKKMTEKKIAEKKRKEEKNQFIIGYIKLMVLDYLKMGETTTATATITWLKNEFYRSIYDEKEKILVNLNGIKKDITMKDLTYNKVSRALEQMAECGELRFSIAKPEGSSHYTKCYTRI